MIPLHVSVALGPLACYFILLGMMNLSARPLLTTGSRDVAALALAVVGLAMVGPMELFLPQATALHYGAAVWLLLLSLYALGVLMLVLLLRPRLVIYNIVQDQLRPILAEVVAGLDADARWAGDSLNLPGLGVQLHLEPFPLLRNIQLVASGPRQNYGGWRRLEDALAQSLRGALSAPNRYGLGFLLLGLLMVAVITFCVVKYDEAVAAAFREMMGP